MHSFQEVKKHNHTASARARPVHAWAKARATPRPRRGRGTQTPGSRPPADQRPRRGLLGSAGAKPRPSRGGAARPRPDAMFSSAAAFNQARPTCLGAATTFNQALGSWQTDSFADMHTVASGGAHRLSFFFKPPTCVCMTSTLYMIKTHREVHVMINMCIRHKSQRDHAHACHD